MTNSVIRYFFTVKEDVLLQCLFSQFHWQNCLHESHSHRNSEIAKTFTSFTFCPPGLPCDARSRPPASRFTSFRSAVVELTTTSLVLKLALFRI